jgi:hypothetical protein
MFSAGERGKYRFKRHDNEWLTLYKNWNRKEVISDDRYFR